MLDLVVNYWGRLISALVTGGPAGYYDEARRAAEAKAAEEARRAAEAKAAEGEESAASKGPVGEAVAAAETAAAAGEPGELTWLRARVARLEARLREHGIDPDEPQEPPAAG